MRRSLPRYVQIESTLRECIVSGRYPAGGPFRTDERLWQEFGVSRATVRLALDTLHREGLIVRYPGRGSFVNEVQERARTLRFHGSVRDPITQGDVHGPTFTVTHVLAARATPVGTSAPRRRWRSSAPVTGAPAVSITPSRSTAAWGRPWSCR